MSDNERTRRRFLWLTSTATMAGLAGCSGGGGGETTTEQTETTASNGGGGGDDEVPEQYATATSQDGTERNPDSLSAKDAVSYQTEPKNGQQCADCRYYIPDKNGDGTGACAIVEGNIEPTGYCVSFVEYQG